MNTSDDDNTLSEMSMSIRGKMARGDGEATKGNKLGRSAPAKAVNDIELDGSKSMEDDDDEDDDEEAEEELDNDSDTQRDKLLHEDADKNNKDSKKQSDIESGAGNSQEKTVVQSDDKSRSKESTKPGAAPAVPQAPGGKEPKKAKAKVCCADALKYVLIVTDNVKLFSYDMSELLRFRGKPITPYDKCQSLLWILSVLFFWVSVILALSWVGGKSSEMVM